MRLFDISEDMVALRSLIDEQLHDGDGELTGEAGEIISRWMSENDANLEEKADSYAALIREADLSALAHEEEAARHQKRAATNRSLSKFLKDRLVPILEAHHIPKIKTRRFNLTVAQNGGVLPLHVVEEDVPEQYKKTVTTTSVDREKIREELTNHTFLAFAAFGQRGKHLLVR